ncbi:hypothetical protein NE857_30960 [Nocardiopsis exhalans]|uniref:Uncharacterized protein n=1 Tax=Nocardiopsis exhalans TaxID=163604 RepID=A0ABY5D7Y8_9ACTN|nr:hypothetical protein [Nocardiopsis exhalans]USY19608.1 hypothetical protein NE857_30960 [Nocardiopsis exhalans]
MPFHSPGRPEDLPDPSLIWALASLSCAVSAGLGSYWPEFQCLEDDGLQMDDGGGNWWRMTRVEGGRILLVGWDDTGKTIPSDEPPIDLLAGAPEWLPWEWVERAEERGDFGFAYWWDGTWQRVPYPDWVEEDGLGIMLSPCSSVAELLVELGDRVDTALRYRDEVPDQLPEEETVEAAIRALAEVVTVGRVSPESVRETLGPLDGALDPEALLGVLERAGLVLGDQAPPEVPAGTGRPATRPAPWVISYNEWAGMVTRVARAATELERPEVPESDLLRELKEWVRGAADRHGGTLTYTALCVERASSMSLHNGAGERVSDSDMPTDVFDLRGLERHPERGSWFFLRVHASPEGVAVERAYDHYPAWWRSSGFMSTPGIGSLRAEMDRRATEWWPHWVWLLDDEIPQHPPEDPFTWSAPPAQAGE